MIVDSGYQRFEVTNNGIKLLNRKKNQFLKYDVVTPVLAEIVKNKTVLDIGASNGLYSFFCALKGAKHVTALENGKIKVGGTNIKLLNEVCSKCSLSNVTPLDQCFTKHRKQHDVVLAFAVMHHLMYDTSAYPDLTRLIDHLASASKEKLMIEWVDVSVGGPYCNRPNKYNIIQFQKALHEHFSLVEELGTTNVYSDPKRPPRIMYLCEK